MLAIPRHEGGVALDEDRATVRFLRGLADEGATLVMHGLTHRMPGRAWTPLGFVRGHVFARGQGELLRATAAEATRALDEGAAILRRAGLEAATRAFVPPAWLLSAAAREVVARAGFAFHETFAGIVHERPRARAARHRLGLAQRRRDEWRRPSTPTCSRACPRATRASPFTPPTCAARRSRAPSRGRSRACAARTRPQSYATYLAS